MRFLLMMAAATLLWALASDGAEAARWCHTGAHARGCAFKSATQCARTARRVGGACRQQMARRSPPPSAHRAPAQPGRASGQVYPDRPYWAAPGECFMDEGYGRWRPCSAGDAVN
jgi:hypothetical protein